MAYTKTQRQMAAHNRLSQVEPASTLVTMAYDPVGPKHKNNKRLEEETSSGTDGRPCHPSPVYQSTPVPDDDGAIDDAAATPAVPTWRHESQLKDIVNVGFWQGNTYVKIHTPQLLITITTSCCIWPLT